MRTKMKSSIVITLILMCSVALVAQAAGRKIELELKEKSIIDLSLLKESQHSIEIAFDYFLSSQFPNGSWKDNPAITSLVLYSIVKGPGFSDDPKIAAAVEKGYAYLKQYVQPNGGIYDKLYRNYATAVGLLAFTAANKPEYKDIIDNARKFLIKFQLDEGENIAPEHKFYGGIGYGGDDRPDLSNTHLALEAIKAAEELYADPVSKKEQIEEHWRKAMVFLARTQNLKAVNKMDYAKDDGGFIYETGHYKPDRSISYGSMTFAGLKSLIFAGVDKDDIRIKSAYNWIRCNYTVEENPKFGTTSLYYYFMTATKCLAIYGGDTIVDEKGKTHYWREDFIKKVISLQQEDGHWVNPNARYQENIKDLATAYSVIAIKNSLSDVNLDQPKAGILNK